MLMPSSQVLYKDRWLGRPVFKDRFTGSLRAAVSADSTLHVADEPARMALTGINVGDEVIQDDGPTRYKYNGTGIEAVEIIGAGTAGVNGYYTRRGISVGKPYYKLIGTDDTDSGTNEVFWTGSVWLIADSVEGQYSSEDDVSRPDLVTTWALFNGANPVPTTARHTSTSTMLVAVFISGSGDPAVDGVYTVRGVEGGSPYYNLLGASDDPLASAVSLYFGLWTILKSSGTPLEFASSFPAAATPWADTWSTSTVASVTQRDLVAGITVAGAGSAVVNGSRYIESGDPVSSGRPRYSPSVDQTRWVAGSHWEVGNDGQYTSTENVAFPFSVVTWTNGGGGTLPVPTVTRNDIASTSNWEVVP